MIQLIPVKWWSPCSLAIEEQPERQAEIGIEVGVIGLVEAVQVHAWPRIRGWVTS